jgi:hypothetical protein
MIIHNEDSVLRTVLDWDVSEVNLSIFLQGYD